MNVTAKVIDGTVRYFDADGVELTVTQARNAVVSDSLTIAETNRRALLSKAQQALTSNQSFLALSSPTSAQNAAQIKALTRQVNALIRLVSKALDSQAGT